MRTIEGENDLLLTCTETPDGVSILRCETRDDNLRLPDEIGGAPVTVLGDYALSERAPDFSGRDTFRVRVTCGGPEPVHDANAIRAVTLPKHLRSVGGHTFYNCRRLEQLELTASVRDFGGDTLMNCHALHRIRLHADPAGPTCLRKILGEHMGDLDVVIEQGGTQARLLFPAYSEVLEPVTPAHIFQRRIHGAGYGYRECFESGVFQPHQYDRALSGLLDRHDFSVATRIAMRRLAAPFGLSDAARSAYLDCLRAHGGELAYDCAATGESAALRFLLSLGVLSAQDVAAACDAAREKEQTAALSVLLAAAGQQQPKGRAKSFDL